MTNYKYKGTTISELISSSSFPTGYYGGFSPSSNTITTNTDTNTKPEPFGYKILSSDLSDYCVATYTDYNSTQTVTPPTWCKHIRTIVIGGQGGTGGKGGRADGDGRYKGDSTGNGGTGGTGGNGQINSNSTLISVSSSITVTIGSKGNDGATGNETHADGTATKCKSEKAGWGGNGSPGGTTSITCGSTTISASGGNGGNGGEGGNAKGCAHSANANNGSPGTSGSTPSGGSTSGFPTPPSSNSFARIYFFNQ